MSRRATLLIVVETIVLVVAVTVAAITRRRRIGSRRPSSRCCWGSRWPVTCSRSATAGSGSRARFLALVLAMALLGPAPATAIGIASVLFDHCARATRSAADRQPRDVRHVPAGRRPADPVRPTSDVRVGRVPAARVRRLHGHQRPELRDDRRPPRRSRRACSLVGEFRKIFLPVLPTEILSARPVRAGRRLLRAHRRGGDRADAARAADVPVPAARAAALARAGASGSPGCSSACSSR